MFRCVTIWEYGITAYHLKYLCKKKSSLKIEFKSENASTIRWTKMQVPAIKRNRSAFGEQMTDSGGERRTRCKIYIRQIPQKKHIHNLKIYNFLK